MHCSIWLVIPQLSVIHSWKTPCLPSGSSQSITVYIMNASWGLQSPPPVPYMLAAGNCLKSISSTHSLLGSLYWLIRGTIHSRFSSSNSLAFFIGCSFGYSPLTLVKDSTISMCHSNDHNPYHSAIHIQLLAQPFYLIGALTESLEQSRVKLLPIEIYQSVIKFFFQNRLRSPLVVFLSETPSCYYCLCRELYCFL